MIKLYKIIKEEYRKFIKENYDHSDYYDREDDIKRNIFNDFLYYNTPDFTKHVPWKLIPYPRLKKIWEDYIYKGIVRDERGLEMIEDIIIDNTIKVNIFTTLAGHTQWGAEDDFEENIGYWVDEQLNCIFEKPFDKNQLEIPFENPDAGYNEKTDDNKCNTLIRPFVQEYFDENYDEDSGRDEFRKALYSEMIERFYDYYQNDPDNKLGWFISDFGLKPLLTLLSQLMNTTNPEQKLVVIDKMLNVIHQRSDIASWFVQGGSQALSQLSGYSDNDNVSTISGKYSMGDY